MAENSLDQAAMELGKSLMKRVAPSEAPYFERLVEAQQPWHKHNLTRGSSEVDHALAFGTADAIVIMSPLLYEVGKFLITILAEEATEATKALSGAAREAFVIKIKDWIRGTLKQAPVDLAEAQLQTIETRIRERLNAEKIDQSMQRIIIAAVYSELKQRS
jgi:hypothetical protein